VEQNQKECLVEVLILFEKLGLSKHLILIGSWVEYFYDEFFQDDYYPNIATRDIDLLYRNIRIPNHKVALITALKELGFIYDENPLNKVARFYKSNIVELEFLTRIVGQDQMYYEIASIGITAEGLRDLSLLEKFSVKINRKNFSVVVPEPAAYVIHKILINERRLKNGKSEKDMRSIKEILYHIQRHPGQRILFSQIVRDMTKKERTIFIRVCKTNGIDLSIVGDIINSN
jgi:hypothetical protein